MKLAAAHAVMISVMVMTPLHMEHGGAALKLIGIVISVHVLGMFAFAPLVGLAVDRWGAVGVLASGGVVLLVALLLCGMAPEGGSHEIFGGLFLLGVGWSMATVAAATLVAQHAPLASATEVQGSADLVMSLAAAFGSAGSGVIVGEFGCGVRIEPGDPEALAETVLEMRDADLVDMGKRGRKALEDRFDRPIAVRAYLDLLGSVARDAASTDWRARRRRMRV